MKRTCQRLRCGKTFEGQRSTAKYCSPSCRVQACRMRGRPVEPDWISNAPDDLQPLLRAAWLRYGDDAEAIDEHVRRACAYVLVRDTVPGQIDPAAVGAVADDLRRLQQ